MASALFSSRSISPESGLASRCPNAAEAANRHKTNTFCWVLGLIFGPPARFFHPLQKEIDPALHVRVLVAIEMQFRYTPELQSRRQLPPQKRLGVFQRRQSLRLFAFRSPDRHFHAGVPRIGTHMHLG